MIDVDVLIIGGGPAGSIAGATLVQQGYSVKLVEKSTFPRFVIGESLLPECNTLLEKANMLDAVLDADFQYKGGAAFTNEEGDFEIIDFYKNMGQKWGSSFQVRREEFDHLLLKDAQAKGVNVAFEQEVVDYDDEEGVVSVKDATGAIEHYRAKKVIDASGYGRVLPRLLDLELPSTLSERRAVFCRVKNDVRPHDRTAGYIYITVHENNDAWFWNIPFNDGITSVGVVCTQEYFEKHNLSDAEFFDHMIASNSYTKERYAHAEKMNDVGSLQGYSAAIRTMHGKHFVLCGNATEFLDPVFSSGVTLALESGAKAAELIHKELKGKGEVDWKTEYEDYMMMGVNTFRAFVEAWYNGKLQEIIFAKEKSPKITAKVVSILSGYVWDEKNMFVRTPVEAIETTARALSIAKKV